jgi:carbamoyl-phosphate synthase small subunit
MGTENSARLVLADGSIWHGRSIGAAGEAGGEVVFNTSLTGYQEILTDPSYRGQIVTMTNPLMGNYGVTPEDDECERPHLSGFIVRELTSITSNWRATSSLQDWLVQHNIVAIEGLDTRALTRKLRLDGAMKGLLTTSADADDVVRRRLQDVPDLVGRDLVLEVTRGQRIEWTSGFPESFRTELGAAKGPRPRVVALDYGAKANIFRSLVQAGFQVVVLPAQASSADILREQPDAVFLSNGPGDPRVLKYATDAARGILGKLPIFGICLGHQILGAAMGAEVFKLKFGHHGGNQPVKDLLTGRVEITAQNHGFAVEPTSAERAGARITHVNLNDGTVEGMDSADLRMMAVQYHPEAAPGPHDSLHLFRRFRALVDASLERAR